ncbi:tyrosine-type recombinase/integrase [Aurantibacillus circumpalustris]|uniref:tyrosine-type recombinase/integrase n=1 Tax=Aurantibacillus circumpalustris TaxID=3036359 RepID=UPI00295A75F2|nr:site-specific integrase [Aurantibacillus circumpalustris]
MQTPKVILGRDKHKKIDIVKISFEKNNELLRCLRKLPQLKWSATLRTWYAPYTSSLTKEILKLVQGLAEIHFDVAAKESVIVEISSSKTHNESVTVIKSPAKQLAELNPDQEGNVKTLEYWMRSRRYSESTISTYTEALRVFLRYFPNKAVDDITNEDLIVFNNQYIILHKLSASYQNQVVNAVKLFFRTVQKRSMDVELIYRPKRAKLLPNVLSKEEVKWILNALNNIKHKTMLSLIYACGLRCGELLRLKPEHVDERRKLLIIKQSKGKKDRIVPLSDKVVALISEHLRIQKGDFFLFEGQTKGQMYDDRSLQQVLRNAVSKAGIRKPVTLHWLRHSYATHLLEGGTDLRYIQEILGHNSSRTTEIYTHVSNLSIQRIISPFDTL